MAEIFEKRGILYDINKLYPLEPSQRLTGQASVVAPCNERAAIDAVVWPEQHSGHDVVGLTGKVGIG